jgi:fluoroquinolone resistance protein
VNNPGLFSINDAPLTEFTADSYHEDQSFDKLLFGGKHIEKVEFYNCTFSFCDFSKAKLNNCEFEKCSFISSDLSLINFGFSSLADVKFIKSKLIGILWETVRKPYRYSFSQCKLDHSSFYGADLRNLSILDCSAREVDFTKADLSKADFSGTDLLNSRFSSTNLSFANFSTAINYGIDPNDNKLKKAAFSYPEVTSLLNYFDIIIKE